MVELLYQVFPGLASMPNIHPMVVHFPIAFLSSFLVLEVLFMLTGSERLGTGASTALYLGALGAAGAVAAGIRAGRTVEHGDEVHAIMSRHMYLGITVLVIALVLSVWRLTSRRRFNVKTRLAYIGVAVVMNVVMAFGADHGGLMVYKYGVGVEATRGAAGTGGHPDGHVHNHDHVHDSTGPTTMPGAGAGVPGGAPAPAPEEVVGGEAPPVAPPVEEGADGQADGHTRDGAADRTHDDGAGE
ncbi:MAG TPA: DUF2231 domain-containing protein [Gammaproteobacteria bacterium]|nr:DUF2231 domain-containing protein [Gammaproteobacteria bacterium]